MPREESTGTLRRHDPKDRAAHRPELILQEGAVPPHSQKWGKRCSAHTASFGKGSISLGEVMIRGRREIS